MENKAKYYDGTKLLSMKDINGLTPEIYLCVGNRTGGKTTYFNRMAVNRFLKKGQKFAVLYRFNYELQNTDEKFFKDIKDLFFPNYFMKSVSKANGAFRELYISDSAESDGLSCGYALSLNNADNIKKCSHLLSDISMIIFDEFQSENNQYCPQEINKFISIHTSLARGHGKQVKYLPVYMLSNSVSLINPYYTAFGISERLQNDTKFLKGDGFVLEQAFVETASKAQMESAFNRAFKNSLYVAYSSQNIYLNDSMTFIENLKGASTYLGTLRYNNCEYGVKEFKEDGIIYVDTKPDLTHWNKISVTTSDHNINYVMLKSSDLFLSTLRYFFEKGCLRFKNLQCKEALMKAISY